MRDKILFIDWHETISSDKFFSSLHNSKSIKIRTLAKSIENFLFVENKKVASRWMTGMFTSEEIIKLISEKLILNYDWLWDVFKLDCKNMAIAEKIRSKLLELKEYYVLVLITGNMDCFNRFTIPSQHLDLLFDSIVNSSDFGYFKTDHEGKAFKDVISDNATSILRCYLLDDNKEVCDVFSKIGGSSINVHIRKSKNMNKRLEELFHSGPNLMLPFKI
jgi:hypothetical protein